MAEVAYYGIRHHGPGSATSLLRALDAQDPAMVLLEGPADATALLPFLGRHGMQPPVALLAFAVDDPTQAIFDPFAAFSPEYQATRWALARERPVRFIDLPAANVLAMADDERDEAGSDPIGELAGAAGYLDGESFWNDLFEANPDPGPTFDAIERAMTELRQGVPLREREAWREAHMRLAVAKARREAEGSVAVVCGAWHVPALRARHARKDDRALLAGLPKRKAAATWVPWTYPRLAGARGYRAGVRSPLWYEHLFEHGTDAEAQARWLGSVAASLREVGRTVSTAELIEATRLARSLAALRQRPAPGFEELQEGVVACLCFGDETVLWEHEDRLLLGDRVGAIPDDLPLAPLLDDLRRRQRKVRLKAEALPRELSVDLRTESGLGRSTLLHQLRALDVPWGRPIDAGRSRGTFREKWILEWEPEHAVRLVEHLVYGQTVEAAADARTVARMRKTASLTALAALVDGALVAQLAGAAGAGIGLLSELAARTSDASELLGTLPPLAGILRYGTARAVQTDHYRELFVQTAVRAAAALAFACRAVDEEVAAELYRRIGAAHEAIALAQLDEGEHATWLRALEEVVEDGQATPLLAGLAARLLYGEGRLDERAVSSILARALSPGTPPADAGGFFEGFFTSLGAHLIHDDPLREVVDAWIRSLPDEEFQAQLPLLRRVFASLDRAERRALIDRLRRADRAASDVRTVEALEPVWAAHLPTLTSILSGRGRP